MNESQKKKLADYYNTGFISKEDYLYGLIGETKTTEQDNWPWPLFLLGGGATLFGYILGNK